MRCAVFPPHVGVHAGRIRYTRTQCAVTTDNRAQRATPNDSGDTRRTLATVAPHATTREHNRAGSANAPHVPAPHRTLPHRSPHARRKCERSPHRTTQPHPDAPCPNRRTQPHRDAPRRTPEHIVRVVGLRPRCATRAHTWRPCNHRAHFRRQRPDSGAPLRTLAALCRRCAPCAHCPTCAQCGCMSSPTGRQVWSKTAASIRNHGVLSGREIRCQGTPEICGGSRGILAARRGM